MPPSTPRPSPSPSGRRGIRPAPRPAKRPAPPRWSRVGLIGGVVALAVAATLGAWNTIRTGRDRPSPPPDEATVSTFLAEATAAQSTHQGRAAESAAERATRLDPTLADAWTLRLNRLRVLDQPGETMALGLSALAGLRSASATRTVLIATTVGTLAEVPDAEARALLDRWIAADPADIDAQVARMTRIAANPHPGDPDRARRIVELGRIIDRAPSHVAAREALAVALADAGEVDRGRATLDGWPEPRDYRFDRLRGRWDLEYDHQPARAVEEFRRALTKIPHDWKLHYGLARSSQILGQVEAAKAEALAVARLRERLEPSTLGPRLSSDFTRITQGSETEANGAMLDLAALCRSVGLAALAEAWTQAAGREPLTTARTSD